MEETHRHAHPEELGRFETTRRFHGLVDDEVTVVEGLHSEELEFHVRHRIKGLSQFS